MPNTSAFSTLTELSRRLDDGETSSQEIVAGCLARIDALDGKLHAFVDVYRDDALALAFAQKIKGINGITLLSAGTDGTDGPTDAAGAVVDAEMMAEAEFLGLTPEAYLHENDSYRFFKALDRLLITGPTGTNVMDLQIILIDGNFYAS